MNGTPFKLATFAKPGGSAFVAIVLGDDAVDLSAAHAAYRASGRGGALNATDSIFGLLEKWEANFPALQEIVAFLEKEGLKLGAAKAREPACAAAGDAAGEDVLRRTELSGARRRDDPCRHDAGGRSQFTGEKSTTLPYLFLKAPSCLAGAFDEIELPLGMKKIDWEAEIALAIGRKGKRIKAERALEHVAGFMTTNDVSCRDLQIRSDRPALRSDWLGGKSHDKFAPMGPFLVPRAFVPDHMNLFIRLTVNGEVKQNGNTSQFIFTPEEQIEYASNILTIESGDIRDHPRRLTEASR